MDNFTHSLIGISIAEGFIQAHSEKPGFKNHRGLLWFISALANNIPDLDFLYAQWILHVPGLDKLQQMKLSALVHHRGFTHTFLFAVPQALVVFLCIRFFLRRRFQEMSVILRRTTFFLCLLGPLVHLFADFWNSYGVHPYWPISKKWVYGDFIFIIEPWLWIFLILPVINYTKNLKWNFIPLLLFFCIQSVVLFSGYVHWAMSLFFLLTSLWLLGYARKYTLRNVFFFHISLIALFLGNNYWISQLVKRFVRQQIPVQDSSSTIHDISAFPMPANPLCWITQTVETTKDSYISRKAVISLLPRTLPPFHCLAFQSSKQTFPLTKTQLPHRPGLQWIGEYQKPLKELQDLHKKSCAFFHFLQFSRIPAWTHKDGFIFGDLRFDRSEKMDFSKFKLDSFTPCKELGHEIRWETELINKIY